MLLWKSVLYQLLFNVISPVLFLQSLIEVNLWQFSVTFIGISLLHLLCMA